MQYLDFLQGVHEKLAPKTYLEIGIRHGHSIALSKAAHTIGVDPDFDLKRDPPPNAELHSTTSDEFFAREDPLAHLGSEPVALSFIDGMHLAEYALRDFINVERYCTWSSVVMIDDILPRNRDEAARARATRAWTGDVFKLLDVFERRRPDLITLKVGAEPTGVLLVLNLDPASKTLDEGYAEIEQEIVTPDPQDVPDAILQREDVLDPEQVLNARFWEVLREGRGPDKLRRAVNRSFGKGLSRLFG